MNKKLSILVCALLIISPITAEHQPERPITGRQKATAYIQYYAKLGQAIATGLLSGLCFKRAISSVNASMQANQLLTIHDAKAYEIFKKNIGDCYKFAGFMNESEEMGCRKMAIVEYFQDPKHDSLMQTIRHNNHRYILYGCTAITLLGITCFLCIQWLYPDTIHKDDTEHETI